jgi:uncharacterized protein YndB with AHSA1/START domain
MTTSRTAQHREDGAGREYFITRDFEAPRERVFRAWTDPKLLAEWWGPIGFTNPVCDWEMRPGGRIHDVMRSPAGADHPMAGQFREITPPERLVFMCGPLDLAGRYIFELLHSAVFAGKAAGTTLTLRSVVLKTTPGADKYLGGYEAGMSSSLDRLAGLLAQKTDPFSIERIFDAPVARVWRAITEPADMKQWYFELEQFRPEPGFEFDFTVEHLGKAYHHLCKVTEVIQQKRLVYSWRYEGCAGDSRVSFDLFAQGERTRLRLTHLGLESFPRLPEYDRKNFASGWTELIGTSLKQFVEAKHATPQPQS